MHRKKKNLGLNLEKQLYIQHIHNCSEQVNMYMNESVGLTGVHAQVHTIAVNSRGMQNSYLTIAEKKKPAKPKARKRAE